MRENQFSDIDLDDNFDSNYKNEENSIWKKRISPKFYIFLLFMFGCLIGLILISISKEHILNVPDIPLQEKYMTENVRINLSSVLNGNFYWKNFNGTWVSDTEIEFNNLDGDLCVFNVTSGKHEILIKMENIVNLIKKTEIFKTDLSPDKKYLLVGFDQQRKNSRNSKYGNYAIIDISSWKFEFLHVCKDANCDLEQMMIEAVVWCGAKSAIAFVYNNDIYYRPSGKLGTQTIRVSFDGSNKISNGINDWVYEEELFNTHTAMWFNSNGGKLAYLAFNETGVDEMRVTNYGEPEELLANLNIYPSHSMNFYPKAGRKNPIVKVKISDLTTLTLSNSTNEYNLFTQEVVLPGLDYEHYVTGVMWLNEEELAITILNRRQNSSKIHLCNITSDFRSDYIKQCFILFHQDQPNGWIDTHHLFVSSNYENFLTLISIKEQDAQFAYQKMVHFTRNSDDGILHVFPYGDFHVTAIEEWDDINGVVYFSGVGYDTQYQRLIARDHHLYSMKITEDTTTDKLSRDNMKCYTCNIHSKTSGELCSYNAAEISEEGTYFAHSCKGPGIPETTIRDMKNSSIVRVWTLNDRLKRKLKNVALPKTEDYDIPMENGFTTKARLILPPDFNPAKKYPLLIDVYGGPGSQKVNNKFGIDWATSLVSTKDIIYGYIDGRGSGRQSDDFKFSIYRKLGNGEVEDQISATKWLIKTTGYIDPERTAIWGWSYGGYVTSMVMGKDVERIFKCGIAIAPVTSWKLYDSIYTERYMGLPSADDNLNNYVMSEVLAHVQNFRHKKFLLIHGIADDNVHFQQSMLLARSLEKQDIMFDQITYPEEDHSLASVRRHLYHSLEKFLFSKCFVSHRKKT